MPTLPTASSKATGSCEVAPTQKINEKSQPSPSQKSTVGKDRPTASSSAGAPPPEQHHDNDLQGQAKDDSDHTYGVNLQPHEDMEEGGGGSDDGMLAGIPWVLPKEPDHVLQPAVPESLGTRMGHGNDSDSDGDQENDEEKGDSAHTDRNAPTTPMGAGVDRSKTYADKRKAGVAGRGGRAKGGGCTRNGKSSSRGGSSWGKTGMGGGDGGQGVRRGYYGPREGTPPSPPCTVFAPTAGKVRRLGDSAALVVGLDAGEQLCFVGATRVRCGCGRADIVGFTLLPVPWGPYLEAHSPRCTSLQVIRALHSEERLDIQAFSSAVGGGGVEVAGARWGSEGEEADLEREVEETIDELAENFAVVVAFRPLADSPLNFLSAQGDADSLNASGAAVSTPRSSPETPALELAVAELRLPGMQVVLNLSAGLQPLTVPQDWAGAVDAVMRAPSAAPLEGNTSVLVCGAKGVGKSSFCRLLVNRMLGRHTKVAYLDCDLGQPEFTTPGLVSLHTLDTPVLGPPHTNIRRPELAYFIGTTSSKPEPLLYSAAVRSLAEQAAATAKEVSTSLAGSRAPVPLVVNTDGWVKGMGEDLLGAVIDAVRPQHIVQLLGTSSAKQFDLDRLPEGCQVHRVGEYLAPMEPLGGSPAPALPCAQDLRTLRLVSYFVGRGTEGHGADEAGGLETVGDGNDMREGVSEGGKGPSGCLFASSFWPGEATLRGGALYDKQHEVAALLSRRKPRRVPWRAVRIRVMNGPVPPNLVLHAINGALVGLIADPDPWNVGGKAASNRFDTAGEGLVCLSETPLRPCVGLGVVRSVDVEQRVLYVLTPEPLEVLKGVNVLVRGSLQLPPDMLYDPNWCSHPYFSAEAVGGEVIKNRNYLLRRS